MAYRKSSASGGPLAVFLHTGTVEEAQARIRFPGAAARAVVPWLAKETITCRLTLRPLGGMRLLPLNATDPSDEAAFARSPDDSVSFSESEEKYLAVLATSWVPNLIFEAKLDRYDLNLPEGARSLKLVPDRTEPYVLFGIGMELQLWHASEWTDRVRKAVRDLDELRRSFGA
jgi:hypothetical protein